MSTNYNVDNTFIKIVTTHKKNVWKILNKKFCLCKKTLLKSNVLSAKKVNKKLATTKKEVGSSKTVNMFLLGKG